MKINGIFTEARYTKTISIKRDPAPAIQLTLRSYNQLSEFKEQFPLPKGKVKSSPGKPDEILPPSDEVLTEWVSKKLSHMILCTIQDVEWDTVDMTKSETWANWTDDMTGAGFSSEEVELITLKVHEVNGLSNNAVSDAEKN